MNGIQNKAREIMELSESYGLKPELTELLERIHIQHIRQAGSFCSVISYSATGRVSVYHFETVSGKDYRVSAADLAQCFERYGRRAKRTENKNEGITK
jgi:hypothetical protein